MHANDRGESVAHRQNQGRINPSFQNEETCGVDGKFHGPPKFHLGNENAPAKQAHKYQVNQAFVHDGSSQECKDNFTVKFTNMPVPQDIDKIKEEKSSDEPEHERGGWGNQLDFLFSCISVSVGLGNIWRFPYLCFKNGGGSFLVTYFVAMIFCGIPLFYQEVAVGQYLGVGGMNLIEQLAPIMKGVGFATMTVVFLINIYYAVIIAWTVFYFIASFSALPGLPWQSCGNAWNTLSCFMPTSNLTSNFTSNFTTIENGSSSAVEEFWNHRVLSISDGIENIGSMQWELLGAHAFGWMLVYFIVWKGLHQSGYIIWFTAMFPYVILSVLLVRAVTLEGAGQGLLYYITPQWELLATSGPWIDGATQIFFAYSIGTGSLPALGSYNKFKYNCYRDAIITCIVNTVTCLVAGVVTFSVLGNIASATNSSVESVVSSGPGLVFITYPEVVLSLPGAPIWAILFFFMLAILGIDSQFCNVESFVTGIVDNWPELRKNRKFFVIGMVVLLFLLSLPMLTEGGVYLFQLMDYYSASGMTMLFLVFFQTVSIGWIFGGKRFCGCIEEMIGTPPSWFFYVCWVYLAPAIMLGIFIFYLVQYTPVTYGNGYEYPKWAEGMGICISLASMLWIPLYAIYYLFSREGSLGEVLKMGVTPIYKSRNPEQVVNPALATSESKQVIFSRSNDRLDGLIEANIVMQEGALRDRYELAFLRGFFGCCIIYFPFANPLYEPNMNTSINTEIQ